jgi:hypothetical protein
MVDFRTAQASFESIGKTLKQKNLRAHEDEGRFIKRLTDSCFDTGDCYYVCSKDVVSTIMQSQRGHVEMRDFEQVQCVLFTPCCRKLVKDSSDLEKVIKILSKESEEDKRCCVCLDVAVGLQLHCQSCTSPICAACFVGMSLADARHGGGDDDDFDDFDDFREPTHTLACPTCRAPSHAYTWTTEACLPKPTRTYTSYSSALKAVISASVAPFVVGHAFRSCFSHEIDVEHLLEGDVIGTKYLGVIWAHKSQVICSPEGTEEDYCVLDEDDCEALVVGRIPECICCADAYMCAGTDMRPSTVLVRVGELIHEVAEAFPLYSSYLALNKHRAADMKREEDEEQVYERISHAVSTARRNWEVVAKRERETAERVLSEFKAQAAEKLNKERDKFASVVMELRNKEPVGYYDCRRLELLTKLKQLEADKLNILRSDPKLQTLELARLTSLTNKEH